MESLFIWQRWGEGMIESEKIMLEVRDTIYRLRYRSDWSERVPEIIKMVEIYGNARVRESKSQHL